MQSRILLSLTAALVCAVFTSSTQAQPTAFSYQGSLNDSGSPANGFFDIFTELWDAPNGGAPVGTAITNTAVEVVDGVFTVTLDFGAAVFDGNDRWLEIGVVTNGGGAFSLLSPRQPIHSMPYAIRAIDAMTVAMGTISDPGFFGTTDTQPLQLQVNNEVGLRLEYPTIGTVPNLVGGYSGNSVGSQTQGAVIAGGGGFFNENTLGINSDYSVIGGGRDNNIASNSACATVVGGRDNDIGDNSSYATIAGGDQNDIADTSPYATITGGFKNNVGADSDYSFVGGGQENNIADNTLGATIVGGWRNGIGADSDYTFIGGGQQNKITNDSPWATIGGGLANDIGAGSQLSFIGGGLGNNIASNALGSIIAGGLNNDIGANSDGSFIGGGSANDISDSSDYATIAGGRNNGVGAGASYAFAAGWRAKANHQGAFVWADSQNADFASSANNQFNVRATGGIRLETAGSGMTIDGVSVSVITDTVPAGALIGTYGNALTMNNLANQFSGQFSGRFQGDGADTAVSPSHTFSGDLNTGMFRPAADTLAFATIAAERMRITSSGDVGIGTSSPEGDLHVRGGDGVGSLIVTPGTADSDSQLLLSENTSASIGGILRYDGSANQIQILGWNNDANTATHVVVGRNNGQVGIGTGNNSVDARLHVEAINARVAKFDRWGSDGQLVAWAKDDGVVGDVTVAAGVVSYNAFTGSHYAWTEAVMERGTLVTMTGQNRLPEEDGEVIYGVTPTSRANDPACLGSYLAPHPGLDRADSGPQHQIMSVGNGEMWVTQGSAGDIAPGDPLISSEVTGCAMKHDPDRFPVGYVCARAAEEVRWQHVPTGADGLKRVRISVLFESFVLDGRGAGIAGLMDTLRTRDLKISRLEERLQRLEEMLLPRMKGSVE